jgi:vitamin B12 transporter
MREERYYERRAVRVRKFASALVLLALLFLFSVSAWAQAGGGGKIEGRVRDERGANVAGAEVRLRSREGLSLFGRTNMEGAYAFTGLGTGDYILEVTARGFAVITSDSFRVERGETVTQDLTLPVAAVSESVVVTATGTAQRADEVSKAVTTLGEEQIEARRELSLSEALRGVPGLRVQQQGSPGALTTLRLRGQRNFDTALLLDGLRVRDASDINGSALPFFTDLVPAGLDRVEILRGSGSSIYGTNAIGGVINLVPKTGAGGPRFEAGAEGGGMALYRERVQGSGGLGRRAGYSFGLTRTDVRRGVDGDDAYGNTAGGARLQFDATPNVTIGANFYGTVSNALVNNNPRPLVSAAASGQPYPEAVEGVTLQPDFNNPDQGRRNRLLVASVRLTQQINELFSYTVAYQRVSTDRRNYNGPEVDPRFAALSPFGDFEFVSTNRGATDTLDARANLRFGPTNLATAGFEFERETLFQETVSAFGLNGGATDRQRTFALFGQDQLFLLDDRLQISLGLRGQFYRIKAADRPGFLSGINAESSITGDASIAYFMRRTGTKLRAHVGNGFRAPSLFERFGEGTFDTVGFTRFGDPTLRAEQSISVDGGLDQRLAGDRVRFGLTYFYTRQQRVIDFSNFRNPFDPTAPPDPLGVGRGFGYLNFPGGLARGLETSLEAAPTRGLDVRASYTYTNSDRFDPALGLQQQFVIPRHLFGLTVNQRWRAVLLSFDLNRTGRYLAPVGFPSVVLSFKGYTKADLFASYERGLGERVVLVLFGGAENIFDEEYFENGFRAPGAVGRGGLSFRF